MSCTLRKDMPIGKYRSLDDIKYFKVRIRIRKIIPVSMQREFGPAFSSKDLRQSDAQEITKSNMTELVVSWQEHIPKNPKQLTETSHSSIEEAAGEIGPIILFTEVDSKIPSISEDEHNVERCRMLRRTNQYYPGQKSFQIPHYLNAKELVRRGVVRSKITSFTSMSILALLSYEKGKCEELQLCVICYSSKGDIIVFPDFRSSPYYIRSNRFETFEFMIEHVSESLEQNDILQEKHFLNQINAHHAEVVETLNSDSFKTPDPESGLWYINGEIVSAKITYRNNIFVKYKFELSDDLKAEDSEILLGTTHTCRTKETDEGEIAHFGFPFVLNLVVDTKDPKTKAPSVIIHIEINSVDRWGLLRNEGYGSYTVPFTPGYHFANINTWKILPQTVLGRLKEYFLGGIPSSDRILYMGFEQGTLHSKYGIKTEASASMHLRFHSVLHFRSESSPHYLINQQQISGNN